MSASKRPLPLRAHPLVATTDLDEFAEALRPIYGVLKFELPSQRLGFQAVTNYRQLEETGIYYGQYGARLKVNIPNASYLAQGITLQGAGSHAVDGVEIPLGEDSLPTTVMNSASVKLDFDASRRHLAFCMRPSTVSEKLAAIIGSASDRRFEIDGNAVTSVAELRRFSRLLMMLVEEFDSEEAPPSQLFLKEVEQSLIVAFLMGYQNNFSHFLSSRASDIAPWQVKRVEQYIEAHWDQPLAVERIAATVEASVRSIFHAFKTSRGYSPMECARRVRLRHAYSMPINPDEGTAVTSVAFACGFGNLGHFSKNYFEEFKELSSATLTRSKGKAPGAGRFGE